MFLEPEKSRSRSLGDDQSKSKQFQFIGMLVEVFEELHPINMFKCRSARADTVSEFHPSPHRPGPSCQMGHSPRRMRYILPKRVRPGCLRKGPILLLSKDTVTSQSSQEPV